MKNLFSIIFYFVFIHLSFSQVNISIISDESLQKNDCTKITIDDATKLFAKVNGCSIVHDSSSAHLILHLPALPQMGKKEDDGFTWTKKNKVWTLEAFTYKGVSNGVYGLMQEIMGFKFYHSREIIIPDYTNYEFPDIQKFSGKPSFANIGFHLHTMHPIELTEDLLDETRNGGIERIYEYIDWLARNGQNYFEFNVLESINVDTWVIHAKKISDYAHQRGIKCGLDLSLHMLQQKAFQLYETPPFKFGNIQKQIDKNASKMIQTGFDVWNVELSATEFTSGDQVKKKKILNDLTQLLNKNNIQLMSRNHVVKPDQMVNGGNGEEAGDILAEGQGLMVHTVMFYSLTDEKAPVYRNKNLRHMYDILQHEKTKRPVWYFPESAYWVTFDSSVPMFLLPYFSARLSDIELCEQQNIDGHLTFTSGWEWGYGFIDWSIARWCWQYQIDDKKVERTSLRYINELISTEFQNYISVAEDLQQKYIKDEELIRVMVAQTITDEIPGPFNLEFHPRPVYSYPYIRNKATLAQLDSIEQLYLIPLKEFYTLGIQLDSTNGDFSLTPIEMELFDGIRITHLRAWHKYLTLRYIVEYRKNKILNQKKEIDYLLNEAEVLRQEALAIVKYRESKYRYNLELLSTKHNDHTCYHFGYLYPVHQLHFWEREQLQAKNNQYNFWYKNIWDVGRTVGLYD